MDLQDSDLELMADFKEALLSRDKTLMEDVLYILECRMSELDDDDNEVWA